MAPTKPKSKSKAKSKSKSKAKDKKAKDKKAKAKAKVRDKKRARDDESKRKRKRKKHKALDTAGATGATDVPDVSMPLFAAMLPTTLSKSQAESKVMKGGRFRWLNEQLYTCPGEQAFELFSSEPSLFDAYHAGFADQVKSWPANPVDVIIDWLNGLPKTLIVADFGCGEAKLAASVHQPTVHSFDLVAANDSVTACDMANVPLPDESVHVAVYSLALMGTNVVDFLAEASRVLTPNGILKIAEVKSRLESVGSFIRGVSSMGFKLVSKNEKNKMFIMFDFRKVADCPDHIPVDAVVLKPCIYKRR